MGSSLASVHGRLVTRTDERLRSPDGLRGCSACLGHIRTGVEAVHAALASSVPILELGRAQDGGHHAGRIARDYSWRWEMDPSLPFRHGALLDSRGDPCRHGAVPWPSLGAARLVSLVRKARTSDTARVYADGGRSKRTEHVRSAGREPWQRDHRAYRQGC